MKKSALLVLILCLLTASPSFAQNNFAKTRKPVEVKAPVVEQAKPAAAETKRSAPPASRQPTAAPRRAAAGRTRGATALAVKEDQDWQEF